MWWFRDKRVVKNSQRRFNEWEVGCRRKEKFQKSAREGGYLYPWKKAEHLTFLVIL